MKALIAALATLVVAVGLFIFGWGLGILPTAYPTAGQEAVLIMRPIIFGHGGVEPQPVKTGRTFVAWTTEVIYVDMQPRQYQVHFDDFMSSDGVPLDFDAVIRLQITDSVRLVRDFGTQWYEKNVQAEFANRVRQAVRKHGMNETAIDTKAIEDIDREVSVAMEVYLVEAKLPVRLIQMTVGKANPPDAIKTQRVETATQQQAILTQKQRKLAEDARLAAEESRATADQAYQNKMGLSPDQFVALEWLKAFRDVCGGGKCTVVTNGSAVPVVNVGR